jgi:hypothetical protein
MELFASLIVKIEYQVHVCQPGFWCSNFFHPVVVPETIVIPESAKAAFGTHPCSGKDNDFFHTNGF